MTKNHNKLFDDFIGKYFPCYTDDNIYHYTSLSALINILSNQKFWLTNIEYLNDRDDGKVLLRELKSINIPSFSQFGYLSLEEDLIKNTFILSFSKRHDNLPLWDYYSKKDGLCIQLDTKIFLSQLKEYREKLSDTSKEQKGKKKDTVNPLAKYEELDTPHLAETHYFSPEKIKTEILPEVKQILDVESIFRNVEFDNKANSFVKVILPVISELLPRIFTPFTLTNLIKNKEFLYEEEVRLVITNPYAKVKFREIRGEIKPFISVKLSENEKLPIRKIWISPRNNSETIIAGIKWLIDENYGEKHGIEVKKVELSSR